MWIATDDNRCADRSTILIPWCDLINTRDLISDVIIMEDLGELEIELDLDLDPSSAKGFPPEEKTLLQETHMALQQFSIGKKIT